MAATFGVCGPSTTVTVIGRPVDRVFDEAQFTGEVILTGRKLRDYPQICDKYDLADTIHTDLSKNRLIEVPAEVCQYRYMERLNCYHNFIKTIPAPLSQLQALTHLNLSRNQLTVLPVCVCELSSLEVLLVSNNKLLSLPDQIGQLQRLMDLDVSCNEITHLPPQIGDLRSLRSLNVRRNLLVELPVEICKLNLICLEISCNHIQKIPAVFCKLEALEEMVIQHNPLQCPPAHVCRRGRQHILKFLHIEAIREDRKRGFLTDGDMKRLLRKSLPNQPSSDEFRGMLEGPEGKWKRHTVLSSDSGYSTADSLDRSGFNQAELEQGMMGEAEDVLALKAGEAVREQRQGHSNAGGGGGVNAPTWDCGHSGGHPSKGPGSALPMALRSGSRLPCCGAGGGGALDGKSELKLQREDYERKKKEAEQIRVSQEEKEGEERRRGTRKEDKGTSSSQTKADGRRMDAHSSELPKPQTHRAPQHKADAHRTEALRGDALRGGGEGGRKKGKRRPAEEGDEEGQRSEEQGKRSQQPSPAHREEAGPAEDCDGRGREHDQPGDAPLSKAARSNAGPASGSKDSSRRIPNCQYRRTASDTTPRRGIPTVISSRRQTDETSHLHKNGDLEEEDAEHKPHSAKSGLPVSAAAAGSGEQNSQMSVARRSKGGERSQVPTPTSSRTISKASGAGSTPSGDSSARGGSSATASNVPRSKASMTPTSTPKNSRRAFGCTEEESGHRQVTTKAAESSHPRSRLEDPRTKGSASSGPSKSRAGDGESKRGATAVRSGTTPAGKAGRSARSLEDVKDSVSTSAPRRRPEQQREDTHHLSLIRQMIESRLKVALPDHLTDAMKDGVVLCHLANHIRPRSVATIHVPSPAVPKLTSAKSRRNLESFLEACRKIGVDQEHMCTAADITEDRLQRVCATVTALVALAT